MRHFFGCLCEGTQPGQFGSFRSSALPRHTWDAQPTKAPPKEVQRASKTSRRRFSSHFAKHFKEKGITIISLIIIIILIYVFEELLFPFLFESAFRAFHGEDLGDLVLQRKCHGRVSHPATLRLKPFYSFWKRRIQLDPQYAWNLKHV